MRTCYTRHLKSLSGTSGSAAKAKRPYYLAEHLHFLQPFTKSRKSIGNIPVPLSQVCSPEEIHEEQNDINNFEDGSEDLLSEQHLSSNIAHTSSQGGSFSTPTNTSTVRKVSASLEEVNKSALEYFQYKKAVTEKKTENPDLDFFKSILPDMREMNADQKRRFKIGVLNLAGQILSEYTPSALPQNPCQPLSQSTCPYENNDAADINLGNFLQFNNEK